MKRICTITITYELDDEDATAVTERADWLAGNVEISDLIGAGEPWGLTATVDYANE